MFQVRLFKPFSINYTSRDFDTLRKAKNYAKKLKKDNPDGVVNVYELGIVDLKIVFTL